MTEARRWELEAKLIYSVIVAGKSAKFADAKTQALLSRVLSDEFPLQMVSRLAATATLGEALREARTGNYGKIERALSGMAAANLNLESCSIEELERIHGIGPKTSRFFIMWTRPSEEHAALDVHVLRWMRSQGHDAPPSTPSSKKAYAVLEKAFIQEAKRRGMTPRELDLQIWGEGKRSNNIPEREGK